MLRIHLIIAIDKNGVMGIKDTLPWKLSDDLKSFKKETLNSPMIMGSKTFKSLPGILPGREHIVLSKTMDGDEHKSVFTSIKNALDYVKDSGAEKVYVIGGANIIEQFLKMNMFDELIITHVNTEAKGDVTLDLELLNLDEWDMYNRTLVSKSDKNEHSFEICKYLKKKKRFY